MEYKDYYKRKLKQWEEDTDFRPNRKVRRLLAKQARARVRQEMNKAKQDSNN